MANQPTRPLAASIILPCFNALEYSRQCVQSLARHTHPAWELIVIDNGSTDQTSFYFQSVADVATFPVTLIRNSENVGFPAACNQGLLKARADHIVLLNNDTVVTDGWLDQLLSLVEMSGPRWPK